MDGYYAGQPPKRYAVNNLVIPSVAANTTVEIAVVGMTGVNDGDIGVVTPTAAPIVGFAFTYFRGTGNDAGVIGVTNFTEGAIDPANTMDVLISVLPKVTVTATITHA